MLKHPLRLDQSLQPNVQRHPRQLGNHVADGPPAKCQDRWRPTQPNMQEAPAPRELLNAASCVSSGMMHHAQDTGKSICDKFSSLSLYSDPFLRAGLLLEGPAT